ncbi:MAG: uroporphyrinogen-III synthase [Coriobacteriia bacterium]|nr:uroporphyrinogen-III synthase [Coriobacteriia bacterium]
MRAEGGLSPVQGPLAGRSVLVTRTRLQAETLAERLEALGAEVLMLPLLELTDPVEWAPVDRAIAEPGAFDWIVFSSANGVDALLARMHALGMEPTALSGRPKLAAVGSATAERMREHGLEVALVPDDFRAEGLVEAFCSLVAERAGARMRVLVARALEAREVLPEALREMGCEVDVVSTYRTVPVPPDAAVIARLQGGTVDAVTLTSGAIARRLVSVLAEEGFDVAAVLGDTLVATIGPVTTDALRELGCEVDAEAREATVESLVDAVVAGLGVLRG